MTIEIKKYNPVTDYQPLLNIIKAEGEEWKDYVGAQYEGALKQSITYVAYANSTLCGYSRSMNDCGLYLWVIDLLVAPAFRGHAIGRQLMECLLVDFPNQDAYVMSDVDEYYKKLGYTKEGSIFKVGAGQGHSSANKP